MGSLPLDDSFCSDCIGEEEISETSTIISVVESKMIGKSGNLTLSVDGFGIFTDPVTGHREVIRRFTFNNKATNMLVQVISHGATITKMKVPDRNGCAEDVVLGFDHIEGYVSKQNPYFGATIGRVCNRIYKGKFYIDDELVHVSTNLNDEHCFHGGYIGIQKRNWVSYVDGLKVVMTHVSEDNSEGFPGTIMISAIFELLPENSFRIVYTATTSKKTPISLTNHTYFNLAGHAAGYHELYKHIVSINADKRTEVDDDLISTGRLLCVGGTLYDLRIPKELGVIMTRVPTRGYDDNFCVTQGTEQTLSFVSRTIHPESGRSLEVYSNQPGVGFYTGNNMPDPLGLITPSQVNTQYFYNEEPSENSSSASSNVGGGDHKGSLQISSAAKNTNIIAENDVGCEEEICNETLGESEPDLPINGKEGAQYLKHGSFCFQTQQYPDAVHHDNFPSIMIKPGETYKNETLYKFGIHIAPELSVCSERLSAKKA